MLEAREKQLEMNGSLVKANLDFSDTIRRLRAQCDRLQAEKEEAHRQLAEAVTERYVKESQIANLRVSPTSSFFFFLVSTTFSF